MNWKSKIHILIASAAISAISVSQAVAEEITVRLDFSPWGIHAAMHLAQQKGWFDEAGLDVDIQDGKGTTNTIQLVSSGRIDVGQVQLGLMALARENDIPLKSFAGWARKGDLSVLVPKDSNLNTIADLKGKKLVTFATSPWVPYIDSFLKNGGLARDDLSILIVAPPSMVASYVSGDADGFMTVGPFGLPLVAQTRPAKQILLADAGVAFPSYGLVALEKTIKSRRDQLSKLATIQQRAWKYIFDGNIEEGAQAIIDARPDNNLKLKILAGQIEAYRPFFSTERTRNKAFGIQSEQDWADAISAMKKAGVIKKNHKPNDFFTNDLLPK
ncbi:MAG: ABC transporter substrate-binding protein [Alphaproteobacteria bacterium]|nr:ABC transporter substrate-binding protein [Alphaproteobacteria bacterium]